jgi:hypothetical protein
MADVSGDNVVVRVTADLQKLEISMKLPRILDIQQIDERNGLLYVDKSTGAALYAPTHVRTIAQKKALQTLPCTKDGQVYFKQTVYLPFKVQKTPEMCNGYGGIQYKCYKGGLIKQLVVELVSASYKPKNVPNYPTEEDYIAFAGRRPSRQEAPNQSVFSLNPETGFRNMGLPGVVNAEHDCEGFGTYGTSGMSTLTGR